MFQNLSKFVTAKSLLAESIETYLLETRKKLNTLEWRFNHQPLKVDEFHIEQFVITEKPKVIWQVESKNSESDFTNSSANYGIEITNQARLYELTQNASQREQVRWSQISEKQSLRAVFIGPPGSGKSFSTKYTIIKKIDEVLEKIENKACRIEEIDIPIWLTANELVSQDTKSPAEAILTITRRTIEKYGLTTSFYQFLSDKLISAFNESSSASNFSKNPKFTIVIDSLDELPKEKKAMFREITKHFDKPSLRVILTCRTLQWEERQSWLGFTPFEIVEIAPLTISQQKDFSTNFFRQKPALQSKFQILLDGNFALSHAFTTPLFITLGCLLHGDKKLTESTTYVQIYGLVISRLFSGEWRDDEHKPYWTSNSVSTNLHLGMLDKISWELFQSSPERNLFTLYEWLESCEKSRVFKEEGSISGAEFLLELENLGFVIKAGFTSQTEEYWSFAHRTFLEFLAARALSKLPNWLEIAQRHFWFAPEWLECLTFLAGLLKVEDVRKLIVAVRQEKDDIFGSMIFLEAKFTGVSQLTKYEDIKLICLYAINGIIHGKNPEQPHNPSINFLQNTKGGRLNLDHIFIELYEYTYLSLLLNSSCISLISQQIKSYNQVLSKELNQIINERNCEDLATQRIPAMFNILTYNNPEIINSMIIILRLKRLNKWSGLFDLQYNCIASIGKFKLFITPLIQCLQAIVDDNKENFLLRTVAAKSLLQLGQLTISDASRFILDIEDDIVSSHEESEKSKKYYDFLIKLVNDLDHKYYINDLEGFKSEGYYLGAYPFDLNERTRRFIFNFYEKIDIDTQTKVIQILFSYLNSSEGNFGKFSAQTLAVIFIKNKTSSNNEFIKTLIKNSLTFNNMGFLSDSLVDLVDFFHLSQIYKTKITDKFVNN